MWCFDGIFATDAENITKDETEATSAEVEIRPTSETNSGASTKFPTFCGGLLGYAAEPLSQNFWLAYVHCV